MVNRPRQRALIRMMLPARRFARGAAAGAAARRGAARSLAMLTGLTEGKRYRRVGGETLPPADGTADAPALELLTSPTPNGHKVSIMLEEVGLPYRVRVIDLGGEQYSADFLAHSPNGKIPALHDHANGHSVFESCACLLYLGAREEGRRFLPVEPLRQSEITQWVFWQAANLGPMLGQAITFNRFVEEKVPYAIERYTKESRRLLEVLEAQLQKAGGGFVCAGDGPTVADFACFPWARAHRMAKVSIDGLDATAAWIDRMKARPAVRRGLSVGFPDDAEGRELGARYAADKRMSSENLERFKRGGGTMLHEKAEGLATTRSPATSAPAAARANLAISGLGGASPRGLPACPGRACAAPQLAKLFRLAKATHILIERQHRARPLPHARLRADPRLRSRAPAAQPSDEMPRRSHARPGSSHRRARRACLPRYTNPGVSQLVSPVAVFT